MVQQKAISPKKGITSPKKASPNLFKNFLDTFTAFLVIPILPDLRNIQPPIITRPVISKIKESGIPIPNKLKINKKSPVKSSIIAMHNIKSPSGVKRAPPLVPSSGISALGVSF